MKKQMAIVGGGVSGLASGLKLLEAGFEVTLFARELPPHTTSDVAAAFWYPDGAEPAARVRQWAAVSHAEFLKLTAVPQSGVSLKPSVDLAREPFAPPDWLEMMDAWEAVSYAPNLHGYRTVVPAIDTPTYMPYLLRQFQANRGQIVLREVTNLAELAAQFELVVNCAGVWAGELVADTAVTPIRGQIIRASKPAELPDEIVHLDAEVYSTYIVPRQNDVILGGSKQRGDWRLAPDPKLAEDIWQRCLALQPALQEAEILEHRVGLRPGRTEVRLELETVATGSAVIHNYGHGSIGHTLAWGCAAEVVALAKGLW
ncbi:MAG: FAD-dependent oxidoreductase [Anaerolineales bacterium]|nr:FAD-dependent oxidoreductase [Anaerolineales bacterium]